MKRMLELIIGKTLQTIIYLVIGFVVILALILGGGNIYTHFRDKADSDRYEQYMTEFYKNRKPASGVEAVKKEQEEFNKFVYEKEVERKRN